MCAVNWPDLPEYSICPECQDETSRIREIDPIPVDEARSRKAHADFESFYEKWDASHPPERLLPAKD